MVEIDHIVKHVYVKGDVEVYSIKKKKHSKVGGRRHAKTDCRINPLASKDKELEES